ncbi:hypothetical protein GPOL_c01800 [Gordonia polyisoprenivorans VH2]|uniref:Uncharacterized protein n=1 Tax=Gordonia polyisoprenivorans (strain DSM 44266 / VH2) TaxID=1112204 RepID=H6MRA8_GORPV|nr:hypothetical protein GPOL_c01800 [Gordonia polyisoprenivorans VH2]
MSAAAEDSGDGEVTPLLADMIETGLWIMALSGENHTVWLEPLSEELSAVVDTADGVGRFCCFDGRRWSPVDDGSVRRPGSCRYVGIRRGVLPIIPLASQVSAGFT